MRGIVHRTVHRTGAAAAVLAVFVAFGAWDAVAQTLHAVIVADTDDESIGVSVRKDYDRNIALARAIAANTGLALDLKAIEGAQVTLGNLRNAVRGLTVKPDDAVLFYYSGHGYRLWSKTSKWPYLYVSQQGLDFGELVQTMRAKKPRLLVAVTDSCNEYADKRPERRSFALRKGAPPRKNYARLWVEAKGEIVIGSSSKGEYAWGDDAKGGYFSHRFYTAHEAEVLKPVPSWETILASAGKVITVSWGSQSYTQTPMIDHSITYAEVATARR